METHSRIAWCSGVLQVYGATPDYADFADGSLSKMLLHDWPAKGEALQPFDFLLYS